LLSGKVTGRQCIHTYVSSAGSVCIALKPNNGGYRSQITRSHQGHLATTFGFEKMITFDATDKNIGFCNSFGFTSFYRPYDD
jgi:hypothetical protein